MIRAVFVLMVISIINACVASAPRNSTNLCYVFEERRSWYKAAKSSEQKWGIPIPVSMAIVYQESGFNGRAKPERNKFLWIFPGRRPSSAYGFAQALDSTWQEYERSSGNSRASRSDFGDAIDFVGWYNANSVRLSGISADNARNLYFAYHEGNGGYQRGSYRDKQWLLDTASRVQENANRFAAQLGSCRNELDKNWFQRLLS